MQTPAPPASIRKASRADIPRLYEIRHVLVKENRLRNPDRVTLADYQWFLDNSAIWVWEEDGKVLGFSAGDPRDGWIWGLFVDPEYEGRGIGKALLPLACDTIRAAGHTVAMLSTMGGTRADRFYRKNGWTDIGQNAGGETIFKRNI